MRFIIVSFIVSDRVAAFADHYALIVDHCTVNNISVPIESHGLLTGRTGGANEAVIRMLISIGRQVHNHDIITFVVLMLVY